MTNDIVSLNVSPAPVAGGWGWRRTRHAFEQHLILSAVEPLAAVLRVSDPETRVVAEWLRRVAPSYGLAVGEAFQPVAGEPPKGAGPQVTAAQWSVVRNAVQKRLAQFEQVTASPIERAAQMLGDLVGFEDLERAIFGLALRRDLYDEFGTLLRQLADVNEAKTPLDRDYDLIALLIGQDAPTVACALTGRASLLRAALRNDDDYGCGLSVISRLRKRLVDYAESGLDGAPEFLGRRQSPRLDWADFAHIAEDAEHILGLLNAALASRRRGVHVLLYGPPGTGKTELAKALARRLDIPLYALGEADENGREPCAYERLEELQFAQVLAARGAPCLFLLDEASDLFAGERRNDPRSRVFLHRLMEEGSVPVIWTTNHLWGFGGSVRRRMAFALEMKVPPVPVRARLWTKILETYGIVATPQETKHLAQLAPAASAIIESVVASAAAGGGGLVAVERSVRGIAKVMDPDSVTRVDTDVPAGFDPALSNADRDLTALADQIAATGAGKAVSLPLAGPPGTGKSAYARHIGEQLGLDARIVRASDLLSAYLGETERKIAAAFRDAAADGVFLVIDEVDSFLADRRDAVRSWEVTAVNEFLTALDGHPLPVACTTNLMERMDRAGLRRFLIHVRFDYLTRAQAEMAFRRFFGLEPPGDLAGVDHLTPADFAAVKRRAGILGVLEGAGRLVEELRKTRESAPRDSRPIGFRL